MLLGLSRRHIGVDAGRRSSVVEGGSARPNRSILMPTCCCGGCFCCCNSYSCGSRDVEAVDMHSGVV